VLLMVQRLLLRQKAAVGEDFVLSIIMQRLWSARKRAMPGSVSDGRLADFIVNAPPCLQIGER